METDIGFTVADHVLLWLEKSREPPMDRGNIENYLSSMAIVHTMLSNRLISQDDYDIAEEFLASKYGIKKDNLFRVNELIIPLSRVMNTVGENDTKINYENNHQDRHITKISKAD